MQKPTAGLRQETLERWVVLFRRLFFLFFLAVFQCTVVSRIGFFGAVPDLCLAYVVRACILTGDSLFAVQKRASLEGLILGFLSDTLGGIGYRFLALFYFLCGSICPLLFRRAKDGTLVESLVAYYLALLPVAVLREVVTLVSSLLFLPSFSFLPMLTEVLLPELFGTLVFALPVFFLSFLSEKKRAR